jgi:Rrf2 family protein
MLSKTSTRAIKALVSLAQLPAGTRAGAESIAKKINAPANYLGKLLRQLSKKGIVRSQKGLGGGFRLAKDPKQISMYDAIRAIENIDRWSGCVLGRSTCSDESSCCLHDRWKKVRDSYIGFLKETTIADIDARGDGRAV